MGGVQLQADWALRVVAKMTGCCVLARRALRMCMLLVAVPALQLVASVAPFAPGTRLFQPVPGAASFPNGGKLCDVMQPPFGAKGDNRTVDTVPIQRAIDACGDLPTGGTVLLPKGGWFVSGGKDLDTNTNTFFALVVPTPAPPESSLQSVAPGSLAPLSSPPAPALLSRRGHGRVRSSWLTRSSSRDRVAL